jgi:hypothetical protein
MSDALFPVAYRTSFVVRRHIVNIGLEFHDSQVRTVEPSGQRITLSFEPAYFHHSTGRPGIDSGLGYVQPAEVVFEGVANSKVPPQCTGAISEAELRVNGVAYSILPIPFQAAGAVAAKFVFCSGAVWEFTAQSVSCALRGTPKLVDTYAA